MSKKISKTKRRIKHKKKDQKKHKTRRRQRGGQLPDPIEAEYFPTKKDLLTNIIKKWTKINCLNHNEGSVMIIENDLDTNKIAACSLFKTFKTISPNILYQYIMYHDGTEHKLLLGETYTTPEIGTKHQCLLHRLPSEVRVIGSGELLLRDKTIFYSNMSSLFFSHIFPHIFNKLGLKAKEQNNVRKIYEVNNMMKYFRIAIPANIKNIIYVKDINKKTDSSTSKGADDEDIETGFVSAKILKPEDFCDLPEQNTPKCIRYVTNEDCEMLSGHPGDGYCGAGVDFCSNRDVKKPPTTQIPESEYIYETDIDLELSQEYLKEQGMVPNTGHMVFLDTGRAKKLAIKNNELDKIQKRKRVWPY
jgi:hypothetical protein